MAQAKIPGGAYLSADGKTWHNANGIVIPSPFPQDVPTSDVLPVPTPSIPLESKPVAEFKATENEPAKKPAKKPAEK